MSRVRLAHALFAVGAFTVLTGFRPDDPDSTGLFRFEPGYDVEHFDGLGGRVRVHFTRTGPDKVRSADTEPDGVPDAVQQVAEAYEEVLGFFAELGYRAPVSDLDTSTGDGGNDRFDVYLIDFAGQADGAFVRERCEVNRPVCSGYVAQENDYQGYGYPSFRVASRILASHELFHAVQAAYDANQGANWSEATATWASEHFDPSLSDFEHFIDGWLEEPERAIDQEPVGPVDGYSYGLALFAQFLSERFGDELHREHWERLEDGAEGVADPQWLETLAALLEERHDTTLAEAWVEYASWVARSGHGGPEGSTFANAADYERVAREVVNLPFEDDRLRVYRVSMQVWAAAPAGRSRLEVALPTADPSELEGLRVVLATRRGDVITSVALDAWTGGIDATGADEVVAIVVNTGREGQSKRPGLCFGDAVEVAACAARLAPVAEPGPEQVEVEEAAEGVESDDADAIGGADALEGAELAEGAAPGQADEGCAGGAMNGLAALGGGLALLLGRRGRGARA